MLKDYSLSHSGLIKDGQFNFQSLLLQYAHLARSRLATSERATMNR